MKNSQKGFVVPLLIIIVLLAVVGGVYYFSKKPQSSQEIPNIPAPTNWTTGSYMDYPSDVSFTPAVDGTREGPTFKFPNSYFVGSTITAAKVTSSASCGGEVQSENDAYVIEGINFYKSADGLTYYLPGACNTTFRLIITGSQVDTSSPIYANLKNIFDKMIISHAKKDNYSAHHGSEMMRN